MANGPRRLHRSFGITSPPSEQKNPSSASLPNGHTLNPLVHQIWAEASTPGSLAKFNTPTAGPQFDRPVRPGMYAANHQPGHASRLNGAPAAQRGGPMLFNYAPPAPHQHPPHAQHHPFQADHGAHGAAAVGMMGHHSNFSSGVMSNASPFTPNSLQNGHSAAAAAITRSGQAQQITEHWAEQLRLHKDAERAHATMVEQNQPHFYARLKAAENRGILSPAAAGGGGSASKTEDGEVDRRRPWSVEKSAKRQEWHNLDMSGQGLRALAPALFSYTFLQEIYIASNKLTCLPAEIGQLRQLRLLEASYNQISEIPPEIAMCTSLKKLLLFNNNIRTLPYELGSLYLLEMLGIEGNPLNVAMKQEVVDKGTRSLINLLREQAPVPLPPVERKTIIIQEDVPAHLERVKVMTWNILCDKYATTQIYGYTPASALAWQYRRNTILQEIRERDADFLCLQEVATDVFRDFFSPELSTNDYKGLHWPRPKAKTMTEKDAQMVDGCAIFYKASKYMLLDKQLIDYANIAINRPDMKNHHDIYNRAMPKDNIAVIGFFESRQTGARIIIVNTHLAWEPTLADVKLVQAAILMESITKFAERYACWPPCKDKKLTKAPTTPGPDADGAGEREARGLPELTSSQEYRHNIDIPLFLCGDFNSTGDSGVVELLSQGRVAPDHAEFADRQYGSFTRDGVEHPFSLRASYAHLHGTADELPFTNYTPGFADVIDYVWYSSNTLEVVSLLGPPDLEHLKRVPGFPAYHFPADHIQIMGEFAIKARKDKKVHHDADSSATSNNHAA